MIKNISILILTLIQGILYSQTHRFIYEMDIKKENEIKKINMALDIDNETVKFYDYDLIEIDSVRIATNGDYETDIQSDQLLLRKKGSYNNLEFHELNFDYFVIKSTDKMEWKIQNESKKIAGYTLQKATTNFGGRNWTAWFTTSIPFQEGPYKFQGLPGLIFELEDDKKTFTYKIVKSKNLAETFNTNNFLENHYGQKPLPLTREKYNEIKLNYFENPTAMFEQSLKDGSLYIGGDKVETREQLETKKKYIQNYLLKSYVPIELDKAIPYPKN